MSNQQAPKNDGRILAAVMSDETTERFTLRVLLRHATLGTTVFVEYADGHKEPYTVVGILEPR
jgi:hypothetical protein